MDKHAPEQVVVHHNIAYQTTPRLNFDLYQPENIKQSTPRPTIVWIHGGGWISGAKDNARGYFKLLAAQGYNVVSVEYQFAPEAIYPTQLNQINQALQFIQLNAKQYAIDANQLFLAGDSAGANLASHYAALLTNVDYAKQSSFNPHSFNHPNVRGELKMEISVKQINKRIEEFQQSGKQAETLKIGYKTYAKLMNEDKFADALKKDVNDPMIRYYKDIKIKLVTEKHHFEVK
ncbi:hypothetical protein FQR65_LT18198 [Abscondita terminalis]|nr:hypothetical protein FQR65_LT18198 [Abscondita terminalis]